MLKEITSLLDGKECEIIAIECEDLSSPAFLHVCIVGYAIKKNIKVIYLAATRNMEAFKIMASKVMIRLSDKLKFLPVGQYLSNHFIKDGDYTFFTCLLTDINKQIEESDTEVFVVCDSFTVFCDFTNSASHILTFIRSLQQLRENLDIKVVITFQSKDHISNIILHESDVIIRIKRVGNGFAKDVTGQLYVTERCGGVPYAESIFNYHLSDRSARLFLPGMLRPEL